MEESKKRRGRPNLYDEPTMKKTFVLPISKMKQVNDMIKAFCKSCEIKK